MTTTANLDATVNSSAQYSIDDGILVPFQVAAPQNSTTQRYNLVSFQTRILSPGSHRLFVQYGVDNPNGSAPLRLDYFIIQNLTIPPFQSATPTSTPSPTTHSPVSGKLSSGALSGIVIGSLVGGALIMFGLIWVIRFFKRKSAADSLGGQPASYEAYGDGQEK